MSDDRPSLSELVRWALSDDWMWRGRAASAIARHEHASRCEAILLSLMTKDDDTLVSANAADELIRREDTFGFRLLGTALGSADADNRQHLIGVMCDWIIADSAISPWQARAAALMASPESGARSAGANIVAVLEEIRQG